MADPQSAGVGTVCDSEAQLQAAYVAAVEQQTVRWQGAAIPPNRLWQALESPDRRTRERAWRLESQRWLADGAHLEKLWRSLVRLRVEKAARAGSEGYPTRQRRDLGYPPAAAEAGRQARLAVEEFVTSVLVRLYERRRRQLGIRTVRPWDLLAVPPGFPVTPVFSTSAEVDDAVSAALRGVGSQHGTQKPEPDLAINTITSDADLEVSVGRYARTMVNHPGTGSEDTAAAALKLLVLHGPASAGPEIQMSLDVARARMRHLERTLLGWAFAAMVDSFEEWTYSLRAEAMERDAMGAAWASIWLRYLPAVDWSGLEDELAREWQRHGALFLRPGESMGRMASEVELFRGWMEAKKVGPCSSTAGAFNRLPGRLAQHSLLIDDMDLLDVARWIEDSIEELERTAPRA
jgi:oligoendopeptidase F